MQTISVNKKIIRSWIFYDWANSVYALVITTAIFPVFYENITRTTLPDGATSDLITLFGITFHNTSLISYVSSAIFLTVALLIPLLSGIADVLGKRKLFLQFFCYLGSISCMALYFFNTSHLFWSLLIYFFAGIGFWGSLVFYNSFLPLIVPPRLHDRVSAAGYAMGYVGSAILLILCLVLISVLDVDPRWSFVLTGLWWMAFAQITFRNLPPEPSHKTDGMKHILVKGWKELLQVFRNIRQSIEFTRFLSAFFVYSTAVQTIMLLAVFFGTKEIDWPDENAAQSGLIISVLIIQFIAIPGSILAGRLAEKTGNYLTITLILVLWLMICIYAYFIHTPLQFYITAASVGCVMGAIQSMSRSTYSKLIRSTDTASYFSFYDITEKIAIVIGTFLFGWVEDLTGSMRLSVIVLSVLFFISILMMLRLLLHMKNNANP